MIGRMMNSRIAPLLVLTLFVAVIPLLAPSNFYLRVAALVWVFSIAAFGLTILMGYAGQVSLGHAGFVGIGAYSVALGPEYLNLDPLVSLGLGVVVSAAVAWIVGRPILKLRGYYLAIATLGFGMIVSLLLNGESAITGGPDGIQIPRVTIFGLKLSGSATWYWVTAGVMLVAAAIALNIGNSPTGRALRALHDSEIAAAGTGIDVAAKKLNAFVLAAIYAAVAGGLLGLMNGLITPDVAGFMNSIELVAMVIIGGLGSVVGAVVGAAFLVVLPQVLTSLHDYEQAVLGLLIMVFMIFLPAGIVPTLRRKMTESAA